MAHPMAYGDSQAYFKITDADVARARAELEFRSSSYYQKAQAARQAAESISLYNAYANQMASGRVPQMPPEVSRMYIRDVTPTKKSSPDRVIADRGFGGADSRPRLARYRRKEPTAPKPVDEVK